MVNTCVKKCVRIVLFRRQRQMVNMRVKKKCARLIFSGAKGKREIRAQRNARALRLRAPKVNGKYARKGIRAPYFLGYQVNTKRTRKEMRGLSFRAVKINVKYARKETHAPYLPGRQREMANMRVKECARLILCGGQW